MSANAGYRSKPARTMTGPDQVAKCRSDKMRKRNVRTKMVRALMAIAVGGSAFQLSGCDPAVRSTLLSGLEVTTTSLTNALISAFFIGLNDDSGTGLTTL